MVSKMTERDPQLKSGRNKVVAALIVVVILIFAGLYGVRFRSPTYVGEFKWVRVVVGDRVESQGVESKVFHSIEKPSEIFSLNAGDECFYLSGEEWVWRDKKDPAFSLAPVFCPKKGGGWAVPPASPP